MKNNIRYTEAQVYFLLYAVEKNRAVYLEIIFLGYSPHAAIFNHLNWDKTDKGPWLCSSHWNYYISVYFIGLTCVEL